MIDKLKEAMTPVVIAGTTQVKYGDFIVDSFLTDKEASLIKFKPVDLDAAYEKNVGIMAFFGSLSGKAINQESQLKMQRDYVRAYVSDEIRQKETEANGKKPSESYIESALHLDIRVVQVTSAYSAAQEVSETLKVLCDAARRRGQDLNYFAEKATAERQAKSTYKA